MIKKCLEIAELAHEGQRRKFTDELYVKHSIRMSVRLSNPFHQCVALLHDILDDSEFTTEDLLGWGVPSKIVDIVEILTRTDETYKEFIIKCSKNTHARKVKIEDLKDNLRNLHKGSMRDKYELALYLLVTSDHK